MGSIRQEPHGRPWRQVVGTLSVGVSPRERLPRLALHPTQCALHHHRLGSQEWGRICLQRGWVGGRGPLSVPVLLMGVGRAAQEVGQLCGLRPVSDLLFPQG